MKNMHRSWIAFSAFLLISVLSLQGQTKVKVDLIVTGGMVVTMDGPRSIYEDGAIAATGDTIVAVGPRTEIEARYTALQTIDAKDKLVLPGFH